MSSATDAEIDPTFSDALAFLARWEGTGPSRHPDDPGGITMAGITQTDWDHFRLTLPTAGLPTDVRQTTEAERIAFWTRRWRDCGADAAPPVLARALFDTAVHAGVSWTVEALQRLLGLVQDGIVGRRTRAALRALDDATAQILARAILWGRRLHEEMLVLVYPKLAVFKRGWLARIDALARELG
jgi:lysozyme family protein